MSEHTDSIWKTATWKIPDLLTNEERRQEAATILTEYFREATLPEISKKTAGKLDHYYVPLRSGSYFNSLGADEIFVEDDVIDAYDILSVGLLSTPISATSTLILLGFPNPSLKMEIERLLRAVDKEVALTDVKVKTLDNAQELYRKIAILPKVGETRATKLLARKRPHLFPIIDSKVKKHLGHQSKKGVSFWHTLHAYLNANDRALHYSLEDIRKEAANLHAKSSGVDSPNHHNVIKLIEKTTVIRVFDIIVWELAKREEIKLNRHN